VRLFTVYRQPMYDVDSIAFITQLIERLSKFANCKSPSYIVGDLNCPAIDWSCYTAPAVSVQDALLNIAVEYSFVQMIIHGSNILDIVLTNGPITLVDSQVLEYYYCLRLWTVFTTVLQQSVDMFNCALSATY